MSFDFYAPVHTLWRKSLPFRFTTMPRGYAIEDTKNWTDFKVIDFELKVGAIATYDADTWRR